MATNKQLQGKVALVTGGSRGLGKEMIEAFAEAGADVVIVSRKLDACVELAEQVEREYGVTAMPYACHMGRWDEQETMVDAVYEKFGRLDVLVNNAGMSPLYPSLVEVSESYFDSVIGVNFKGPFRLTALVGARMKDAGGGSIINVSSTSSLDASPNYLPYAAAKAALNNFALSFSAAYGPEVRVNTLCVGPFATDVAEHWADPRDPERPGWTVGGRRVGRPDEVVGAALFFASEDSSYTSGALLRMDGGPARIGRTGPH